MEVALSVIEEYDRFAVDHSSSALRPRTASAILEKRPVKSAPRRLQTVTPLALLPGEDAEAVDA